MAIVRCPACVEHNEHLSEHPYGSEGEYHEPTISVQCTRGREGSPLVRLDGLITCAYDGHKRPIILVENILDETARTLPSTEATKLSDKVLDGIREDLTEAETDHFNQSYKSSVVMCRRAIQLALENRTGITRLTLGPLLAKAREQDPPILSEQTDHLAERVHTYGDIGAHSATALDPKAVEVVIFDTVIVVNEVFEWQPAS